MQLKLVPDNILDILEYQHMWVTRHPPGVPYESFASYMMGLTDPEIDAWRSYSFHMPVQMKAFYQAPEISVEIVPIDAEVLTWITEELLGVKVYGPAFQVEHTRPEFLLVLAGHIPYETNRATVAAGAMVITMTPARKVMRLELKADADKFAKYGFFKTLTPVPKGIIAAGMASTLGDVSSLRLAPLLRHFPPFCPCQKCQAASAPTRGETPSVKG